MSKLNKDILLLIFEELQDDSKSLFSCLMVNRIWCETVIPVLWRNPWRYGINYHNKNNLFAIFISCLPNEIKEFLASEGIKLPPISYQPLLFDYLSFCRSINANIMNDIISTGTFSDYNRFLLQKEFYNILMRKCPGLKYLDMESIKHQIFYFPEAKSRLYSLCELRCDTSTDPLYFYGLASVCQYIQKIVIINTNRKVNDGTVKLIEVQRNLKYFEWEDSFDDEDSIEQWEDLYPKIFLPLAKHANTLNHFITNLHIDYRYEEMAYHGLETFELLGINIHMVTCMIKNSGGYLREISIYDYYIDYDTFHNDSLNLIHVIYENCALLEDLSLPIFPSSKNHFNEFEKLLETCQKLQSLRFRDIYYLEKELEYVENLLNVLIRASSANLRCIRFSYEIKFSLKILEEFLEKWRGRPAITIFASYSKHKGSDYVNLINKYKDNGVIKNFVTSPSIFQNY